MGPEAISLAVRSNGREGSYRFTCPSCDGYEARDRNVVVLSTGEHLAAFAVTLLDWATSVTALAPLLCNVSA